jgi:hypothetical protein
VQLASVEVLGITSVETRPPARFPSLRRLPKRRRPSVRLVSEASSFPSSLSLTSARFRFIYEATAEEVRSAAFLHGAGDFAKWQRGE